MAPGIIGLRLNHEGDPTVLVMFDYRFDAAVARTDYWDPLANRAVLIVLHLSWSARGDRRIEQCRQRIAAHRRRYPMHRLVYACGEPAEAAELAAAGMEAIWCNHNAFVDENLFCPPEGALPGEAREFDALYDARFARYKRHLLAVKVPRLLLIHRVDLEAVPAPRFVREIAWILRIRWALRGATILNRHRRFLLPVRMPRAQVAKANRRARVGLCLSAVEGAMLASIQYLLSGLPVVTTPSQGGREVFFDAENSLTVEPTPDAVAAGVREAIARRADPWAIRARALERIAEHRRRFHELVISFQAAHGVPEGRRLSPDWERRSSGIFTDRIA